ncbi:unnamed protein product [Aspergillus oryzae]|uniref:Unnamed protein product n=1 Tax=Aspergillus oryzae TaxID=5062 RepID=A0AAN4YF02_ASPOZ|nr:unnamed protein product [Aspergillus oryzae]GMG27673.1 unnamed protein product [Aspergillus oryzae]
MHTKPWDAEASGTDGQIDGNEQLWKDKTIITCSTKQSTLMSKLWYYSIFQIDEAVHINSTIYTATQPCQISLYVLPTIDSGALDPAKPQGLSQP